MGIRKKRAPVRAAKASTRRPRRPLLTSLSSDWYWEQDAELRFRRIDVQAGSPGEQRLVEMNLGKRPWETGVAVDGGWEAHRELLKARAPFRELLMWRELDDGSRRYITVSGEPVFDAKGRFTGYRGVGRDITEQKRGEQLLRLQHTVTRRLAEAASAEQGVEAALRAVCETEGWDVGQLWRVAPAEGLMRRYACWVRPGFDAAGRFAQALGATRYAKGEGLLGAAWNAGAPLWVPDTTEDARAKSQALARESGLRAALFSPILGAEGAVIGMLSFDCRKIRPPDQRLLDTLGTLATQLGLYLRRTDSEKRLRESEVRFRRTFELVGSGIAHVDMQGRFLRVNPRLCEILGYPEGELLGRSVKDVSHPEDRDVTDAERSRLHAGEVDSASFEKRYLRKDGATVWTQLVVALERDATGRPLYEVTLVDDISARKAAEQALRESEARFRRTFELAGVGVALIGLDRRFQRVNRRFCEILGYPEAELIGNTGRALSHPEDLDAMNAQRPRLYAGEVEALRGEKRYLRKDGSVVWVAYTLAIERDAAGKPLHEIAVYDDVSTRKAAEQALRESEARFRSLTDLSSDWFWEQDSEFRFTRLEGRNIAAGGRDPREVIGTRCWDGDLEVEGGWEAYRALLQARKPFHDVLMWRRLPGGAMRYVRISGEPVLDGNGGFAGYRGVGRDVSGQKHAEERLRESEARFRSLTDLSSDWFWEQDSELRFTRLEGRNVAGGDADLRSRLIGRRRWETGLEIEGGWEAHRALLAARRPYHDVLMWRRMSDGSLRYVSVSGEPVIGADGGFSGYRGVGRDVTEEKRAERLLRLEHQVARALSEVDDEASGLDAVLRAVCEEEHWSCGRFFRLDEARGEMLFERGWGVDRPEVAAFLEASREKGFRRGEGLIGHAWTSGEAVWSSDTAKDPRSLALGARLAGLHGAFVFPVSAGGRVLGALAFVSDQVRKPDERLLQATRVLGAQVGQFLQRKRAEDHMRRFRLAMDGSGDMIFLIDRSSMRYVDVNATACSLLGYGRAEVLAMGPQDMIDASREELERAYDALLADPSQVGVMNGCYRRKDGSLLPFESKRRVLVSGGRAFIVAISRDVRDRIAAEEALRESEARFRALTEMSSDFFWETDAAHRLTDMVYGRNFLGRMDEVLGKVAWEVPYTHPDEATWAELRKRVDAHQPFRDFEFGRAGKHGKVRYFSVSGEPRFATDGRFLGYRGVGRDVTETMLARERIASLAYHDPLTGLGNRTSLGPALEQAVERSRRRGSRLAAVFLDLDGFKEVNDLYGHDAGDRLLVEVAGRLRAALRSSDPVARLGGDEFFVVLEDLRDNAPAERVAKKLLAALAEPYDLGAGREVRVSASIGISVFPEDAGDAATLMKHADTAMYGAKQAGKNAYRFFMASPAANDPPGAAEKGIL